MKKQFAEVDDHFKRDDEAFEEYKRRVKREFGEK